MFLVQGHEEHESRFALKPMNCPGHMLLFGSRAALATATCRSATPSRRRSTATSAAGRCTACCASSTSPRTTRTSSARRSRSRTRSTAASTTRAYLYDLLRRSRPRAELSTRPDKQARHRRGVGLRRGRARDGARAARDRVRRQRGRGRVLRAEDRPAHDRRRSAAPGRWGRSSSTAQMPQRFGLTLHGRRQRTSTRPFVIHRALLGSLERFIGILIEHYGGAFPFWLAPVQVRVLPVGEGHRERRARRSRRTLAPATASRSTSATRPSASGSATPRSRRSRTSIVYGDKESRRVARGPRARRRAVDAIAWRSFARTACYAVRLASRGGPVPHLPRPTAQRGVQPSRLRRGFWPLLAAALSISEGGQHELGEAHLRPRRGS